MSDAQPDALRLADALDAGQNFYFESSLGYDTDLSDAAADAAAELRRLHEKNEGLFVDAEKMSDYIAVLERRIAALESEAASLREQNTMLDANLAELEQQQEPIAWGYVDRHGDIIDCITPEEHARAEGDYRTALYTAPPRREWVGLTDEKIEDLEFESVDQKYGHLDVRVLSRAIETALKERNA